MDDNEFHDVFVSAGEGGWGRGLLLTPTDERKVVLSVTGGGIHPVAARIAELTGAQAVDGFSTSIPDNQVLAVVINCGGTARIGVYPRKKLLTIDVFPGEPSGPLAEFITEDLFVSAVRPDNVALADGAMAGAAASAAGATASAQSSAAKSGMFGSGAGDYDPQKLRVTKPVPGESAKGFTAAFGGFTAGFGSVVGNIINTLLSSGRKAIQLTLQTILPFMAYVSLLIGFVTYTGLSKWIAGAVTPLASSPWGLILLSIIVALPFLSPILGPGAAIAQVIGVLMGTQIAIGALPIPYALPTLFAIDGQVGCDFVPVGLSLGEAQPETVAIGVPAVLFSRLFTSPIAVIIAWLVSFLL